MKGQKGSALLTVILIIFLTTTIGTALSSMVIYNYRLRSLDIAIQRSEYEVGEILDYIVFMTQKEITEKLYGTNNWIKQINDEIISEIEKEVQDKIEDNVIQYIGANKYYVSEPGVYLASDASLIGTGLNICYTYNNSSKKIVNVDIEDNENPKEKIHSNYDEYLKSAFISADIGDDGYSNSSWHRIWINGLGGKINQNFYTKNNGNFMRNDLDSFVDGEYNFCIETSITDTKNGVVTSLINEETGEIKAKLRMYYQRPHDPVVEITAYLTIIVPTYQDVIDGVYNNLSDYIGITGVKYRNWGNI